MLKSEPKCITISALCILVQHYGLLAIYTINCKLFVRGLCNIYFYVCLILFSQMVIFMSVMYVYTFMAVGSYLLSNKAYMSVWVTIKQNLTHHLFSRKMTVPSLEYYSCLTLHSVGFIDLELTFEFVFYQYFLYLLGIAVFSLLSVISAFNTSSIIEETVIVVMHIWGNQISF